MKVESVRIEDISPDPANVRKHSPKNLAAIRASLRRFGQQKPIVVDGDGVVRAGNGTLAAATELGWTHIDVVRTELTGSDAVAYAIADNRTAELAEWDGEALQAVLRSFDDQTMEDVGFSVQDVQVLSEKVFAENAEGSELPSDASALSDDAVPFTAAEEETMFFSVVLPRSQHEVLIRATELAKKETGEQRLSHAIHYICKRFLGEGDEQ